VSRKCQDSRPMAKQKKSWPLVRPRSNQNGSIVSYMVDAGMMNRKRVRFFFKTRRDAETKAELMRVARTNEGIEAFGLSGRDRIDAQTGLELLRPHGITLRQAAEFYLSNIELIKSAKTFSEVLAELLTAKEQDGKAARYLQDMRNRLGVAETVFGDRLLFEIKSNELDDWLRSLPVSGVTRNNFRRLLGVFFGHALKRGYILSNPVERIAVVKTERGKPSILSLAEAQALMSAAEPELVPALSLALFAGLRPESEIFASDHPLDWSQIELDDKEHRVIDVQQSKTIDSQRYVEISDNLRRWLLPHRKNRGPVCSVAYYDRLRGARNRAVETLAKSKAPSLALQTWPIDVCRHTFASMHYARHKDAHRTSEQLGHYGGVRVFLRHYKNRVKGPDAVAFWKISPAKK
jgi:site-specific recombinase XerC